MVAPPLVSADPERYATLQELKAGLLPDEYTPSATVDTTLLRCLDTASGIVEAQTGRVFTATPETRQLTACGCHRLYTGDLAAITAITGPDALPLDATAYAPGPVARGPWRPWRWLDFAGGATAGVYAIDGVWGF